MFVFAGGAEWMVTKAPGAAEWREKFPEVGNISADRLGQPAHNTIVGNSYCKCKEFIDATQAESDAWGSTVGDNDQVGAC